MGTHYILTLMRDFGSSSNYHPDGGIVDIPSHVSQLEKVIVMIKLFKKKRKKERKKERNKNFYKFIRAA